MEVYTKKIYLNKNNKPVRIIDEEGKIINLEYDSKGNVIRDEYGHYYAYDVNNNIIYNGFSTYVYRENLKILEISTFCDTISIEKYEYNNRKDIIYKRHYSNNNNYYCKYKYDTNGHLIEKAVFEEETIEEYNHYYNEMCSHEEFVYKYSEIYDYDENGRLLSITDKMPDREDSLYREYKYDENGNKIYFHDVWDETEDFFDYDENGNMIYNKFIDFDGDICIFRYEYDQDNNIIKEIREGDGTTPEDNIIINYEYYDESEI